MIIQPYSDRGTSYNSAIIIVEQNIKCGSDNTKSNIILTLQRYTDSNLHYTIGQPFSLTFNDVLNEDIGVPASNAYDTLLLSALENSTIG